MTVRARALRVLMALVALLAGPAIALAADASPEPSLSAPARLSCTERYPADGPAGLDLQLGCIAAEIVGQYAGTARSGEPGRISAWLAPIGAFIAGLLALLFLGSMIGRRFNRRMALVMPASWWSCPRCRSLNGANVARCYACGQPWTPDAMTVPAPGPAPREAAAARSAPGSALAGLPGDPAASDGQQDDAGQAPTGQR